MRHFARRTNAFSTKIENHVHALSLESALVDARAPKPNNRGPLQEAGSNQLSRRVVSVDGSSGAERVRFREILDIQLSKLCDALSEA